MYHTTELTFTLKEMTSFLTKRGYEVQTERVTMSYPCYHNEAVHEDCDVLVVYRNGKRVPFDSGCNYAKEDRVVKCFDREFKKWLLERMGA